MVINHFNSSDRLPKKKNVHRSNKKLFTYLCITSFTNVGVPGNIIGAPLTKLQLYKHTLTIDYIATAITFWKHTFQKTGLFQTVEAKIQNNHLLYDNMVQATSQIQQKQHEN